MQKENSIDQSLKELSDQVDRFKTMGVDKCFVPSIYVHTYGIAKIISRLDSTKFNESQKKIVEKLDNELFKQFQRLSNGRCKCSIAKNI